MQLVIITCVNLSTQKVTDRHKDDDDDDDVYGHVIMLSIYLFIYLFIEDLY